MNRIVKLIKAPFFFFGLLLSFIPVLFIFAAVTIGSWCEDGLWRLGYRSKPAWLPGVLGILGYGGLGVAGPAYLGNSLIGWPGVILGPLAMLGVIAVLGKW